MKWILWILNQKITYVGETELVTESALLLHLLLNLDPAQCMGVDRELVHIALVRVLLTKPEIVSWIINQSIILKSPQLRPDGIRWFGRVCCFKSYKRLFRRKEK